MLNKFSRKFIQNWEKPFLNVISNHLHYVNGQYRQYVALQQLANGGFGAMEEGQVFNIGENNFIGLGQIGQFNDEIEWVPSSMPELLEVFSNYFKENLSKISSKVKEIYDETFEDIHEGNPHENECPIFKTIMDGIGSPGEINLSYLFGLLYGLGDEARKVHEKYAIKYKVTFDLDPIIDKYGKKLGDIEHRINNTDKSQLSDIKNLLEELVYIIQELFFIYLS